MALIRRILITGAAGDVGRVLRRGLGRGDRILRLTDRRELEPAGEHEEVVCADLADLQAAEGLMEGVDCVVHLAAIVGEMPWDEIFPANYVTTYNVFEAARRRQVARVVFASSIHAVGFYRRNQIIDMSVPPRPDGHYGVSKVFGEALGRLYADKHGLSVVSVRINTFEPRPQSPRELTTWLSHPDGVRLFDACIDAPAVHYDVVYGVSANSRRRVTNDGSGIAFYPQDDAESFADLIADGEDPVAAEFHGGPFCAVDFVGPADRIR